MALEKFFAPASVAKAIVGKEVADVTISAAKTVQSQLGKKSLTRATKDMIFQFPMIMSASIDTDDATVLVRASEQNYAAMMLSWLSLNPGIDHSKYKTVGDYLKEFHTNSDKFELISNNKILESYTFTQDEVMALWDIPEERITMESINDIYQPFKQTKLAMEQALCQIKGSPAMEAGGLRGSAYAAKEPNVDHHGQPIPGTSLVDKERERVFGTGSQKGVMGGVFNEVNDFTKDVAANKGQTLSEVSLRKPAPQSDSDGKDKKGGSKFDDPYRFQVQRVGLNAKDAMSGQFSQVASMAPTMINAQFINYDTSNGSSVQFTQTVTLGVKAMARFVRSPLMVANMVEACTNTTAFKFLKATKGESNTAKMLFDGLRGAEWADIAKSTPSNRWLKALRKRKKFRGILKFVPGAKQLIPNTTIVITEGEALMIESACGVDLHEVRHALGLLDRYFLLGFGIYNTETKIVHMIYDGDSDFSDTSLRQLTAQVRKDTNLLIENR